MRIVYSVNLSLQLACPVCSPVRMWNVDHTEIRRTETGSISHVVPATHPQNSLVPLCNQRRSDQSDGAGRSHIRRQHAVVIGHVRRLPEEAPVRMAMWLAVDTWGGGRPNNNPHWKRRPGRPRHTWVRPTSGDRHRYLCWDKKTRKILEL